MNTIKPTWDTAPDDARWLVHCAIDGWKWFSCRHVPAGMTLTVIERRPIDTGPYVDNLDRETPPHIEAAIDAHRKSRKPKTARYVGVMIRNRRKALGLSHEHVAARSGFHRNTIRALEDRPASASLGLVMAVLHALNMTIEVEHGDQDHNDTA